MVLHTRVHAAKSHARSWVHSSVVPLFLGLGLAVATSIGFARTAHSTEPIDATAHLAGTLHTLTVQHRGAAMGEQARLSGDLLSVAARRHQLLSAIIQDDPGAVLWAAMPARLRAGLPHAVQAYVEEEMDVEGELEVLHEDRDDDSRYLYSLKVKEERFSLHFAAHPPTLHTGSWVRVRGIRVERALALEIGRAHV